MTQQILVPIDGSCNARKALEHACMMQQAQGGTLHLLHIVEPAPASDSLGAMTGSSALDYTAKKGREQGEALLKEIWSGMGAPSAEVRFHVDNERPDRPDRTILAQAEKIGADVIVMGSRGLSDLKGLVTGSVSHKVAHAARCAVITLHVPEPD